MTAQAPASSAILAWVASGQPLPVLKKISEKFTYLLSVDHIHNNTSFQHTGQTSLDGVVRLGIAIRSGSAIGGEFSRHVCGGVDWEVL